MGGTPSKMAKRDRFIENKMREWIKENGEPIGQKREQLLERFRDEYFGVQSNQPPYPVQFESNIKLRF
jgi:hypothetical protein